MALKGKLFAPIFLLSLLLMSLNVFSQVTTAGREFWVGFMDNNQSQAPDLAAIIISANEPTKGIIDLSGVEPGRTESFELTTGQNFILELPSVYRDYLHRSSGIIEKKGIFIQSDGDISVYAFNERARSSDGTVVLPIQSLGKDYWITSHFEILPDVEDYPPDYHLLNADNESLMLVVGVEDNTTVQIITSVDTEDGKIANVPFLITLNQGESYQLMARGDLTGSRVTVVGSDVLDCKNVAVFGGSKWTGVGQCGFANDHLFQQMYPINTWGTEFIHIPFATRTSGELVKVLASEDNTGIFINGTLVDQLDAGSFSSYDFGPEDIRTIRSSKPVSVTVFSKSQECNDIAKENYYQGDPLMILYSPNQQMLKNITFEAMEIVEIQDSFVSILVESSSKNKMVLDGLNIGGQFQVVPGNPDYSYAIVRVLPGSHTLTNPDGFIAYVYGFGYLESYGYSVGASLDNLNFETDSDYEFEVLGEKVACLDEEGTWSVIPENEDFQYFVWDFGDGSETKEGAEVFHIYKEPGKYTAKIIASISQSSCDSQEDVIFEVEVMESSGRIEGIDRVCPLVEEHWYEAVDLENVSRIEWSVDGGEIIEEEDNRVLVRWGAPNDMAKLTALPYGVNGCPGAPFEFEVRINLIIEPGPPKGETEFCFDEDLIHEYEVDLVLDNRAYYWFIEGGEIISSNELPVIEVKWNQPGVTGRLWYRESSINDELCVGDSDPLVITVRSRLSIQTEEIKNVQCFGEADGEIHLKIEGGASPYTVSWSHDPVLNGLKADRMAPGNYQVKVTDALGCEAELTDLSITEPALLEAEVTFIQSTSCFGREDGEAIIQIKGGTPPYRISHDLAVLTGSEITMTGLPKGIENVSVLDAQDCKTEVSFEIESPLPLLAEVKMLKPSCPGESDGELMVTPLGGVSPYQYTWDYLQTDGPVLSEVPKGQYTATVVDARSCISFGTGEVSEKAPVVRMPTGFKPSDGGINGIFEGVSNCDLNFKLSIYNRWGELIYHGTGGWDGMIQSNEALPGTYSYLLEYSYFMDGENWVREIRGLFTLLR